jgi:hypothetical protein
MAPKTETDPQQLAAEAQTEAEEVKADIAETKADIAETKEDIAEAKEAGDSGRVARLEEQLKAQDAKLDTVIAQLGKIADRPFHPAPELAPEPAAPAAGTPETPAAPAAEDKPAKPKGRRASRAFFGSRVDDDD